jgi:hypothetical protein
VRVASKCTSFERSSSRADQLQYGSLSIAHCSPSSKLDREIPADLTVVAPFQLSLAVSVFEGLNLTLLSTRPNFRLNGKNEFEREYRKPLTPYR